MLEPPEQELELLIGLTFRLTSNDMAFTSDVMTNAGYVVPKNAQLTATTSLTDVMIQGMRLNFVDYFDGVYVPFVQAREPGHHPRAADRAGEPVPDRALPAHATRAWSCSARRTTSSCRAARSLWLEDVFGDRARIFPTGGHCGSMDQREFVRDDAAS